MTRLIVTIAAAVLSFSIMVVAVAATAEGALRRAAVASSQEEAALNWEWNPGWPAPRPPLDDTPITPVESAGAPMFW